MHGIYMVLVVLALCFLRQRRPAGTRILGCLITGMCIFGTVAMVLQAVITSLRLRALNSAAPWDLTGYYKLKGMADLVLFIAGLLTVTNNAIADSLLIYRCFVLWHASNRNVIVLPVLLGLGTLAWGYVSAYQLYQTATSGSAGQIYIGLVLATNLVLSGLTVGRILYTRRHLQVMGQTKFIHRYNVAIQMLLESAVIYLLFSCAMIAAGALGDFTVRSIMSRISAVLVNISPALLVVRISLGQKSEVAARKSNMVV
ncbi:hypothetical protein C8R44DRAFT_225176 [Mycena epipterygia]|nr:hypothetical protein C8R44DRAFT_225176 [Mycena epipterygia]